MRALLVALLLVAACSPENPLRVTFGDTNEGLDGFLCKDTSGQYMLDRLRPTYADGGVYGPDAGVGNACLVTDFVQTNGAQECRTSRLIKHCKEKGCAITPNARAQVPIQLPYGVAGVPREEVRKLVHDQLKNLQGDAVADAPDGFVMMRAIATMQPCDELKQTASGVLPEFDKAKLLGCAYSCPLLFDQLQQEVYLGFDTLTATCEQGVRTCSDSKLIWNP